MTSQGTSTTPQTREQLTAQLEALRARLVQEERDHRRSGENLDHLRHEINQLRARLRSEPPTQ